MAFVSYAQNQEDVLLWRVLKDIEKGFYIDVGAWDPDTHSVTKAFYDRGWSGINIEPQPTAFRALSAARPRDRNLQVAIGDRDDDVLLYDFRDTGLSTLSATIAQEHKAHGFAAEEIWVAQRTLRSVCEEFVTGPVHFLKIDVEGAEREVLKGGDFKSFRPWIIVVESTHPLTKTDASHLFSDILKKLNYKFALFDGLNSYFVDKEKIELLDALAVPVNVFDDYQRFELVRENFVGTADRFGAPQLSIDHKALQQIAHDFSVEMSELKAALSEQNEVTTKQSRALLDISRTSENQSHALNRLSQKSESQSNALYAMQIALNAMQHEIQFNDRFAGLSATLASARSDILAKLNHIFDHASVIYHKTTEHIDGQQRARDEAEARMRHLEDTIAAIKTSTSWRVTAPLRAVRRLSKLFRGRSSDGEVQSQGLLVKSESTRDRDIEADLQFRSAIVGIGRDASVPELSESVEKQLFLRDLKATLSRR